MTAKKFVLDTNVLLHDPMAASHFAGEEVIVPIYAIEEIDHFKRELSERGRNARLFSRYLDNLRQGGSLADGVATASGGCLRVAFVDGRADRLDSTRPSGIADDLILAVAVREQEEHPTSSVVVVTRDVNLRIRADAIGLQAVDYRDDRVEIAELYSGTAEVDVSGELVDKLYADGSIPYEGLLPNQCALVRNDANPAHAALAYCDPRRTNELVALRRLKEGIWGIRPRNKEQHFAFELLMNDEVKLVTLVGKAGTGKTLLAIAAGLQKILEEHRYQKLLVSRPIFPLGRDIGFLPGDVEEKLNPWMQPIFDNLELLLGIGHGAGAGASPESRRQNYRDYIDQDYLQVEPLTYIRGRSIPNQFMIVDEAQNLTPLEVKTILTRAGDNTKIILTGDPYQIDNPYIDSASNGLSTVVERFKGQPLMGHITLVKGERSALAELASNVM